jgi:hypothetical protein
MEEANKHDVNKSYYFSPFYITNDKSTILYHIFYPDKIIYESKTDDYKLQYEVLNRELNLQDNEFFNTIPINEEDSNNHNLFIDKEATLHKRFLKVSSPYCIYFKEPYRAQYKFWYYFNWLCIATNGFILFYIYPSTNKLYWKSSLFFAFAAVAAEFKKYKIVQNVYKDLFSYIPQNELEDRIRYLEENKNKKKWLQF